MSRIGKLPIAVPKGVTVTAGKSSVTVKGPKGELVQDILPEVTVTVGDDVVTVDRKNESKRAKSCHGLYRKLIANMVTGVSQGFTKTLIINGVGYRAEVKGNILMLNLGYSNPIEYVINKDLTITCDGPNKVLVTGIDKQKVGQASAEIRSLRPPEPYKGKGIKYETEYVRRKVGKSGAK